MAMLSMIGLGLNPARMKLVPAVRMPLVPTLTNTLSLGQQASGFGSVVTTINTPRQFQFAARFTF
ncbi:MAG: hypothetical protein WBX22_07640 [Silvibacterium sp.]